MKMPHTSSPPSSKATIGLKTAVAIMKRWGLTGEEAATILRVSPSTCARATRGTEVTIDRDQLTRVSLILNIHAALRIVFENPENLYGFMSMKNNNSFFDGRSPREVISSGDMIPLYETFRRIDALRGAGW